MSFLRAYETKKAAGKTPRWYYISIGQVGQENV